MAAKPIDGSAKGPQPQSIIGGKQVVESARCHCCGLTEECTPEYIARVRERHHGNWICGLCAEAVKYEALRSRSRSGGSAGGVGIGADEAMRRHVEFCERFRSASPPISPAEDLMISAMKQILRRSIDSPRKGGGGGSGGGGGAGGFAANCRPLGRSKSCFATIPEAPSHE